MNSSGGSPSGTSYTPFGSGGVQPTTQQQAALTQQYNATQGICSQNSTSPDCQAAQAAYSSSYYSVYPNSNATIQNAENTTVGAGADCTYSPCAAGLTCGMSLGYPTCEASGGSGGGGSDFVTDEVYGCANQNADNYNSSASADDGSCQCTVQETGDIVSC